MTPKDKAFELIDKYLHVNGSTGYSGAIKCALITVDEIKKHMPSVDGFPPNAQSITADCKEYWQQVNKELLKL